jgi:SNF2 family DNA or RNA helicase
MLVVDEGQRRKLSDSRLKKADNIVKSDSNLIFNRLKTLNTVHRILLTGTPLNNNLRELFNLLNFLDPINFKYVLLDC